MPNHTRSRGALLSKRPPNVRITSARASAFDGAAIRVRKLQAVEGRLGFASSRKDSAIRTDTRHRPSDGGLKARSIFWIVRLGKRGSRQAGRVFAIRPPIRIPSTIFRAERSLGIGRSHLGIRAGLRRRP